MATIVDITRAGYIILYGPDGERISQHRSEFEAIENIGEDGRAGKFRIVFPDLDVITEESGTPTPPPEPEPGPPVEEGVVGPRVFMDVFPQEEGGIFENDKIENSGAQYQIIRMEPLGGFFEWFKGGAFEYTRAGNIGKAWFDYEVVNHDGQGNNLTARVTIDVQ